MYPVGALNESKDVDSDSDDFFLWSPGEEGNGHCLFGHETQYHRKIIDHRCYIGRRLDRFHKTLKNCSCTPEDYECDFNFERVSDGTCKLVAGFSPPDNQVVCNDKNVIEYFKATGYRRLPVTTCQGGRELDKIHSMPCPGKKAQWKQQHQHLGRFGLFLAIVVPFVAAAWIGYWMWTRLLVSRFGAIRLGEDGNMQLVQYPIIVMSAFFAVSMSIPGILSSLGGWVSSKFTRTRMYRARSHFADYSILSNDEGELLGSDNEV
jgi:hypothetical protein